MITTIQFEEFSPGMRAKLDPKYRRLFQSGQRPESVEFPRSFSQGDQETALPFTAKTKSFGTYVWRARYYGQESANTEP